ncbi:NAD(+) diphosphatase [Ramlibacter alkalitolerans]|uniref:NAD(+) diphosphatase n=1 Tax=Ramlibacter alkalitolerans TaxID=2039631 RepID=A0ABS1JLZ4_9BURK|nr:NAD(+) diphosphatase [Ramlibacter alkalitolerans]MBL0425258.1 NAD(+) diphosphatase [Ramlibacter alkalitolerans]
MLVTPSHFVALHAPQPGAPEHIFVFRGGALLVREPDLALPTEAECLALGVPLADSRPVGMLGPHYCRAAWVEADAAEPAGGFAFRPLRSLFGALATDLMAVAGRAFQVAEWARTHRFCGACGGLMEALAGERCMRCTACGHAAYPRISPAMMVLVRKGEAILLARNAASPTGRFSALAGFLEAGESVEDAVHREVFEEVGLRVRDLRYFGSQSWPFPHSLMIAFTAEWAGGEITVDAREIAEARWFGPGDPLPEFATGVSISGELIRANLPRAAA